MFIICLMIYAVMMGHLAQRIVGRFTDLTGQPIAWRAHAPGSRRGAMGGGPMATGRARAPHAAPESLAHLLWRHRYAIGCVALFLALYTLLPPPRLVPGLVLSWFLLTLSLIDYHSLLLPDRMTLPFLLSGIGCAAAGGAFCPPFEQGYARVSLHDSLLGALCGAGGLWLLNGVFGWVKGYAGLGGGDIKLLGGLGAWLGWPVLPLLCAAAALTGLVWWLWRRRADNEVPFGPFLALAGWMIYIGP